MIIYTFTVSNISFLISDMTKLIYIHLLFIILIVIPDITNGNHHAPINSGWSFGYVDLAECYNLKTKTKKFVVKTYK